MSFSHQQELRSHKSLSPHQKSHFSGFQSQPNMRSPKLTRSVINYQNMHKQQDNNYELHKYIEELQSLIEMQKQRLQHEEQNNVQRQEQIDDLQLILKNRDTQMAKLKTQKKVLHEFFENEVKRKKKLSLQEKRHPHHPEFKKKSELEQKQHFIKAFESNQILLEESLAEQQTLNQRLEQQILHKDQNIDFLRREMDDLQAQKMSYQSMELQNFERLKELEIQVEDYENHRISLEAELSNASQYQEKYQKSKQKLKQKEADLNNKNDEIKTLKLTLDDFTILQEKYLILTQEKEKVEKQLENKEFENKSQHIKINDLHNQLNEMEGKIQFYKDKDQKNRDNSDLIQELRDKNSKLSGKVSKLKELNEKLQEDLGTASLKVKYNDQEKQMLNQKFESEYQALEIKQEQIQQEKSQMELQFELHIKNQDDKIHKLQQDIETLIHEKKQMMNTVQGQQSDFFKERSELEHMIKQSQFEIENHLMFEREQQQKIEDLTFKFQQAKKKLQTSYDLSSMIQNQRSYKTQFHQ